MRCELQKNQPTLRRYVTPHIFQNSNEKTYGHNVVRRHGDREPDPPRMHQTGRNGPEATETDGRFRRRIASSETITMRIFVNGVYVHRRHSQRDSCILSKLAHNILKGLVLNIMSRGVMRIVKSYSDHREWKQI